MRETEKEHPVNRKGNQESTESGRPREKKSFKNTESIAIDGSREMTIGFSNIELIGDHKLFPGTV